MTIMSDCFDFLSFFGRFMCQADTNFDVVLIDTGIKAIQNTDKGAKI